MPTPTYTSLATITLGSSASSVTFSSIPATYRDLVLVVNGTLTDNTNIRVRFNGDTGSNYSFVYAGGTSSGPESAALTFAFALVGDFGTSQSTVIGQIMDYSATDKHKTVLGRGNRFSTEAVQMTANRWANTSAITSIVVFPGLGSMNTGTTLSLYGIAS
jgi:hypothetical protein